MLIQKDTCTTMFKAALFTVARIRKQTKCPATDKQIKTWYIYYTYRKNKPQVCLSRELTQAQREFVKTSQFRKVGMWEEYTKGSEQK